MWGFGPALTTGDHVDEVDADPVSVSDRLAALALGKAPPDVAGGFHRQFRTSPTADVRSLRDGFEVIGVRARRTLAQVVNHEAWGDRAASEFIGDAMGWLGLPYARDFEIAIAGGRAASQPQQAALSAIGTGVRG